MTDPNQVTPEARNDSARRAAYTPPALEELGVLLDVTMGGSPGFGESENTTLFP